MAAGVLRETKDAGEVDVDERLPVFFRVFGGGRAANDAGVVDQNVDGAEVPDGFVTRRAQTAASPTSPARAMDRAKRFELLLRGFRSRAGAVHGDVGAGLGKATAMPAPRPREEPVTRADFPLRLNCRGWFRCSDQRFNPFQYCARRLVPAAFIIGEPNGETSRINRSESASRNASTSRAQCGRA